MLRSPPMIEDVRTDEATLDRPLYRYGERMTIEQWAEMERGEPGELVDGVLVEEEVPNARHDILVMYLSQVLGAWVRPLGGRVFSPELKFKLGEDLGRKPDVSLFLASKKPPPTGAIPHAPDVMIEVISSRPRDARCDRVEKTAEYAAFGVKHYWLADIELRTLEILELDEHGRYVHAFASSSGSHAIPGCPGLVLNLDELWAELDWVEEHGV